MKKICFLCGEKVRFEKTSIPQINATDGVTSPTKGSGGGTHWHCPKQDCPGHKSRSIPPMYVHDYYRYPPILLTSVGFSGHGKTVFLSSLLHALRNEDLSSVWPQFYTMAADQNDLEEVERHIGGLSGGVLPKPNPPHVFPNPTLLRLHYVPRPLRQCTLVMYDVGGGVFNDPEILERYANYFRSARVVVFLINMPLLMKFDAGGDIAARLNGLVTTYVLGMGKMVPPANPSDQNLVIAYTAADEMGAALDGFEELHSHVQTDGFYDLRNVHDYLRRLRDNSEFLKEFTCRQLGIAGFKATALGQFRKVEFCLVSSLGMPPGAGKLRFKVNPRRVLDPLLLAISDNYACPVGKVEAALGRLRSGLLRRL